MKIQDLSKALDTKTMHSVRAATMAIPRSTPSAS